MFLRTLGGLELLGSEFSRPKPLLLLAYLALEGPKDRRFVAELFWPGNERARRNLSTTLSRVRKVASDALAVDRARLDARLETDADEIDAALGRGAFERALGLYRGPFLAGLELPAWGVELEEWVQRRRERYAAAVQEARLELAERAARRGEVRVAARRAARAWRSEGAPPASSRRLARMHALLRAAGSPLAAELRREADALGVQLPAGRPEPPASPVAGGAAHSPYTETPFVGREEELALLAELLARADVRLLTLVGTAGVGKTRLAFEAAERARRGARFGRGVHIVSLAPVATADEVVAGIAEALGAEDAAPPLERVAALLRERPALLVLDNVEHVVEAAPRIADLLDACPRLTVLATSRVPLGLHAEREIPLAPLPLPPPEAQLEALARAPAVALFVERARRVRPRFALTAQNAAAVAAICRRLDGVPLALELAATRVKLLAPEALRRQLEQRLDRRLDLLSGGSRDRPARHRTLRAAIDWSHDLLRERERRLFRRLAVFVGGFTLGAAAALVGDTEGDDEAGDGGESGVSMFERLAALVDESLVRAQPVGPEPRFGLLETIRAYAAERLDEAGERTEVERAHSAHFTALAEEAAPHLTGPEQRAWTERLAAEHDNLRAALRRAEARGDVATGLRLCASLWRFWIARGHMVEGRDRLERLLALPGASHVGADRARALDGLGTLQHETGDFVAARATFEESLALWRALGETRRVVNALNNLGWIAFNLGDNDAAQQLSERALVVSRAEGARRGEALALNNLGWIEMYRGRVRRARPHFRESLALRRSIGDRRGTAFALTNLAWAERLHGRPEAAEEPLERAFALLGELDDDQLLAWTETVSGHVALDRGDVATAIARYRAAVTRFREVGNREGTARALLALAAAVRDGGDPEAARAPLNEALDLWRVMDNRWGVAAALWECGAVAAAMGDAAGAAESFGRSLTLHAEIGDALGTARDLEALAALHRRVDGHRAVRLLAGATRLRERLGAPPSQREAERLADLRCALRDVLGAGAFDAAWAEGWTHPVDALRSEARITS